MRSLGDVLAKRMWPEQASLYYPCAGQDWLGVTASLGVFFSNLKFCERAKVLPHPDAKSSENIIDVWAGARRLKAFSISWAPDTPWMPPVVHDFKTGDWLRVLGYIP